MGAGLALIGLALTLGSGAAASLGSGTSLGSGAPSLGSGAAPAAPAAGATRRPPLARARPTRSGQDRSAPLPVVRWRADPGLEGLARRLAADPSPWRPLPAIGRPGEALDTVEVWIVRELSGHPAFVALSLEPWVAGVADPGAGRIALRTGARLPPVRELSRILRHEVAHLGLHAATAGNHPRWLTEGYAQLAAGEFRAEEAWTLRFAFLRGGGASLERVSLRLRGSETEARLGYLLAYTAVHHLLERGGESGLRALLARLRAGDSFDAALRLVYGVTEPVFERQWRESVLGRYGWLYALSRAALFWVSVALLVAWVAVRRMRRDRRRLEALREAERLAAGPDAADPPAAADPDPGGSEPSAGTGDGR